MTKIAAQLRMYMKENPIGKVVVSPINVYFGWNNVNQPDIVLLTNEQLSLVQDGKVKGAPALVVEVLSPGTEKFDRKEKKEVYENCVGKEYWLVEPVTKKVLGYQLLNNSFSEILFEEGLMISPLLGVTIRF